MNKIVARVSRIAALSAFLGVAQLSAHAVVLVTTGNTPGGNNVLFNNFPPDGTTIEGRINQSSVLYDVNFTSTQTLHGNGGQARVEEAGGGNLTNLCMFLDAPYVFTQLVANPFQGSGNLSIIVTSTDGVQTFNPFGSGGLGNGQNFFTVQATGGTTISQICLTGASWQDLRQIRVGGIAQPTLPPSAVPEPGTWALLIGMGSVGGFAMRRRRAKSA